MDIPKSLIALGLFIAAVGIASLFLRRYTWLYSWFGNLPGDIRYEGEGTYMYAPLVSMLVVSAFFSFAVFLVRRFWD